MDQQGNAFSLFQTAINLEGRIKARTEDEYRRGNAGGVRNVAVEGGSEDLAALCRRMHRGLLVTELMGQGVNGVTGDYSRGAAGFWVEDGKLARPVEEITIAGNLRDMYRRILAIGNDTDVRGNIRTGSILIEEMTIAGE
jgi:PmbA protein